MKWEPEKWLSEDNSGLAATFDEYRHLSNRELSVVTASILDACLAELLSARVLNLPKEAAEFFGFNGNNYAPGATFGARIHLAVLLGIIRPEDGAILRSIKNIRNAFAHKVRVDFTSPRVQPLMQSLFELYSKSRMIRSGTGLVGRFHKIDELHSHLDLTPEAGAVLLLAVFCLYKERFHSLSKVIQRVDLIREEKRKNRTTSSRRRPKGRA